MKAETKVMLLQAMGHQKQLADHLEAGGEAGDSVDPHRLRSNQPQANTLILTSQPPEL